MAVVKNFIYCLGINQVNNEEEHGINAIGVISALTPEFIPTSFSFSILLTIFGLDNSNPEMIKIIVTDPNDNEIINIGDFDCPKIPADDIQNYLPTEAIGIRIGMDFKNIILEQEGYYTTTVYYGNKIIGSDKIYAIGKRNHGSSN